MKASIILAVLPFMTAFLTACTQNSQQTDAPPTPAAQQDLAGVPVLDPVKVDAKHYKVEFENEHIRVLRITYGAHEKSPMHHHPAFWGIDFTSNRGKELTPDGKSQETTGTALQGASGPAVTHAMENLDDQPTEGIVVELKDAPASPR